MAFFLFKFFGELCVDMVTSGCVIKCDVIDWPSCDSIILSFLC